MKGGGERGLCERREGGGREKELEKERLRDAERDIDTTLGLGDTGLLFADPPCSVAAFAVAALSAAACSASTRFCCAAAAVALKPSALACAVSKSLYVCVWWVSERVRESASERARAQRVRLRARAHAREGGRKGMRGMIFFCREERERERERERARAKERARESAGYVHTHTRTHTHTNACT